MKKVSLALASSLVVALFIPLRAEAALFGVLAPQENAVTLAPSSATVKVGESGQANASGGSGDGALTVTGITPSICSVSPSGTILGIALGTCSFFATRAQSGTYLPRSSSTGSVTIVSASGTTPTPTTNPSSTYTAGISVVGEPYIPPPPDLRAASLTTSGTGVPTIKWEAFTRGIVHFVSDDGDYFTPVNGSSLQLADLTPGRTWQVTLYADDFTFSKSFKVVVAPLTPTTFATKSPTSLGGAYTLSWKGASFSTAYRVTYSSPSIKSTTLQVSSPEALIFFKVGEQTNISVVAVGQGGVESKSAKLVATLSNSGPALSLPIDVKSKVVLGTSVETLKNFVNKLSKKSTITLTGFSAGAKPSALEAKMINARLQSATSLIQGTRKDLIVKTQIKSSPDKSAKGGALILVEYKSAIPNLSLSAG